MSRDFVSASSQYLNRNSFAVVGVPSPRTINVWGRTSTVNNTLVDFAKTSGFGINGFMQLGMDVSGNITLEVDDGTTGTLVTTSAAASADTWFMATGVVISSTSRAVYIDGGNVGDNTTSVDIANYRRLHIGAVDGGGSRHWNGQLAEIAIWETALTSDEIATLYESRSQALYTRPDVLVFYMSMMDDADYGEFGTLAGAGAGTRLDFTANGGPTVSAEHPPIVRQAGGLF